LDIARLDLNENLLHFAEVALHRTEIDYRQSASALPPSPDSSTLSFPDLGWRLLIDRIDLAENRLYYDDQRLARQP
ncbi:MAG: hypothetical protein KDC32_14280, partial [Saprospiraceae bacterium]|nr:hypothetical protein [Saprospiraceae bacterium]